MSRSPQEQVQHLQDTVNDLLRVLHPFALTLFNGLTVIAKSTQAFTEVLVSEAAPHFRALAQIDWDEVRRRLDELPAKSKSAMAMASAKGWFFGWDQSLEDLLLLVEKMAQIDLAEVDELLAQYYRKNLQSMAQALAVSYPERAIAISAAVKAHAEFGEEGYYLAVPVFIAQADGLLTQITGVKSALMKDRKSSPAVMQASEALHQLLQDDQRSLDMVTQFLNLHEHDFMKSEDARVRAARATGGAFTALNRHQVMHGEVSGYGNEINSLKAFSFLSVIGLHLPLVLENLSNAKQPSSARGSTRPTTSTLSQRVSTTD